MSEAVLTGPLLDFGTTYWGSGLMREEHEGLWAMGFEPTGRFGIGFFSVFMWGNRVRVTTRRYDDRLQNTKILEFRTGLEGRPFVRPAQRDEKLHTEEGTRVRVWLSKEPREQGGLLWPAVLDEPIGLGALCAWLAPALDVDVYVEEPGIDARQVVAASDWLTISGAELLSRLSLVPASQSGLGGLRHIKSGSSTKKFGRASILHSDVESFPSNPSAAGVITVGGLRAKTLSSIMGILIGSTKKAARDDAAPLNESALAKWASGQAKIVSKLISAPGIRMYFAASVLALGGDPGELPIVRHGKIFLNREELEGWSNASDEVIFCHDEFIVSRALPSDLKLLPNLLIGCASLVYYELGGQHIMPNIVRKALARVWRCSPYEIGLERSSSGRIGVDRDGNDYRIRDVIIFRRPKSRVIAATP
jgi:hypothetical protein